MLYDIDGTLGCEATCDVGKRTQLPSASLLEGHSLTFRNAFRRTKVAKVMDLITHVQATKNAREHAGNTVSWFHATVLKISQTILSLYERLIAAFGAPPESAARRVFYTPELLAEILRHCETAAIVNLLDRPHPQVLDTIRLHRHLRRLYFMEEDPDASPRDPRLNPILMRLLRLYGWSVRMEEYSRIRGYTLICTERLHHARYDIKAADALWRSLPERMLASQPPVDISYCSRTEFEQNGHIFTGGHGLCSAEVFTVWEVVERLFDKEDVPPYYEAQPAEWWEAVEWHAGPGIVHEYEEYAFYLEREWKFKMKYPDREWKGTREEKDILRLGKYEYIKARGWWCSDSEKLDPPDTDSEKDQEVQLNPLLVRILELYGWSIEGYHCNCEEATQKGVHLFCTKRDPPQGNIKRAAALLNSLSRSTLACSSPVPVEFYNSLEFHQNGEKFSRYCSARHIPHKDQCTIWQVVQNVREAERWYPYHGFPYETNRNTIQWHACEGVVWDYDDYVYWNNKRWEFKEENSEREWKGSEEDEKIRTMGRVWFEENMVRRDSDDEKYGGAAWEDME